jgi:hypothetical protein
VFEGLLNFEGLATVDVTLAALFLAGIIRLTMLGRISSDPSKAFAHLERSIIKAYPSLPVGYTSGKCLRN